MIPARRHSEGGSRRSSILKPPKQRQPLQSVVITPSSSPSETTPATKKIKRRVSFAEKKHVKEFCDSFEQGTVWDNTYEENDFSHQKAIHSGNLDEGSTTSKSIDTIPKPSIIVIDKENYPLDIQIFQDHHQLNTHSEIAPVIPFFDDLQSTLQNEVLKSSAMETDLDLPDDLIHTEVMQHSNNTSSEKIPSQEKNFDYSPSLNEENESSTSYSKSPLQNTIYDNESMAFTKIIPSVIENDKENIHVPPIAEKQTERVIHNFSMDFTEVVSNSIHQKVKELDCVKICIQETEDQDDDGMELTLEYEAESKSQNGLNETKFNNISMEMTTAIPSLRLQTSDNDDPEIDNFTRRTSTMEKTSLVPSIAIQNQGHSSNLVHWDDEKTSLFRNSMEFTTAVPSCFGNQNVPQSTQLNTGGVLSPHKSMEFTSVVPSILPTTVVNQENLHNRKILSQNKSMEFTTAVPSCFGNQNVPQSTQLNTGGVLSPHKSMEFTSVVPSILPTTVVNQENLHNRKILSQNKSMEFTTAVPSCFGNQNVPQPTQLNTGGVLSPHKSMEFTTVVPSIFPGQNNESGDLEDNSAKIFSSLPVKSSFNSPDSSETSEKRRKLTIPDMGLVETKSTAECQTNFENCSHIGVEEKLRRSDGISLLKMELTEPFFVTPPLENHCSSQLETLSPQITVNVNKTISRDSNIGQNNSLIERTSIPCEFPLPPSLSLCNPFLDTSKPESIKYIGLDESEAGKVASGFSGEKGLNETKEDFNVSDKIKNAEENEAEVKDVEEVNEDVGNKTYISNNESSVNSTIGEGRLHNFFIGNNSKTIENEEPPSFLNLSISVENSGNELSMNVNEELTKNQERLEKQKVDLEKASGIGRKRSYEASGICKTENQVEESLKRCSFEKAGSPNEMPKQMTEMSRQRRTFVVNPANPSELDNSLKITESIKTVIGGEKLKERTELRRTFVLEKGVVIADSNTTINRFKDNVESSENASNKRTKKRNSTGNSVKGIENSTCEPSINYNNTKNDNSKKESHDRFTFVINKLNLNSQNDVPLVEEPESKDESLTNVDVSEGDISCPRIEIENYPREIDDFQKQILNREEKNQDGLFRNDLERSIEEDPFCLLLDNIRSYAQRNDCIWDVRFLNDKMLSLNFISKSLVVIIEMSSPDEAALRDIKDLHIKSLLPDGKQDLMRIVHDLILHKVHPVILLESYKLYEDVLPLLEEISKEVKLALNFMFELQKLKDINLMEIDTKRISFVTRTKRMDIILGITLNIKPFDEINTDDVNVKSLLGSININEVKQLITNVKKDHKFLRRFMNDVRDYVELMEESAAIGK